MADYGAAQVDDMLQKIEKRLRSQYSEAVADSRRKLKQFTRDYNEKNKAKKQAVKAGKLSKEEYQQWLNAQAYRRQYLEEMLNTLSMDLSMVDVKAMSIVRGYLPEAYAINMNYGMYQVETGALLQTNFTLYNAQTVERLIKDRPNLLPEPKPDIPKELRWHKQKITNAITQGILQGESIPTIAKRLEDVVGMDYRAALRNARTAMTGAQNAGRVDAYKYAESIGINLEQEWLATLDGRTRESHRWMDGERAAVDTEFSNGCRYPGDPAGPPEEIYNCRCTLIPAIEDINQSDAERNSKLGDMDYDEWKWGKEDQQLKKTTYDLKATQKKFDQMTNKTFSGIWKNDVKLSDYKTKAASIPAKRDYYEKQMQYYSPGDPKYEDAKQKLKQLDEFERLGKKYTGYQDQIASLSKELKQLNGGDTSPFSADAYTQARLDAAVRFDWKEQADKYFRPLLDEKWDSLTDDEKYALWKYTENSNSMNRPLSGYDQNWARYNFNGVGNVSWGAEDRWRNNPSVFKKYGHADGTVDHGRAIANLTNMIEKSELKDDVWLVRSSDNGGFAGLLEGNTFGFSFEDAKRLLDSGDFNALKNLFEGQEFQSHAFMSTGASDDIRFTNGVRYHIYCPAGTKGAYAEPQSYYGGTVGSSNKFYQKGQRYNYVGGECEVILQRGTTFRITRIERASYYADDYDVYMEVVNQPDYFSTGYEYTHNNGATSHPH